MVGAASPVRHLIMVDLPAPLAPTTTTREDRDTFTDTPVMIMRSVPGYL